MKRDRITQIEVAARGQHGALLYALGESGDIYTLDDRYENARWTRVRVSPLLRKRPMHDTHSPTEAPASKNPKL